MRDSDKVTFGEHKGKMWGELPADYCLWFLSFMKAKRKKSPWVLEVIEYLEENKEYYEQQLMGVARAR